MSKILIAGEDYAAIAEITAALEGAGHQVVAVETGLDAWTQTVTEQPNLVIVQGTLAIYDGFETCQLIRDDPDIADAVPILILVANHVDPRKLEQAGATAQLQQGLSSVHVCDAVMRHMSEQTLGQGGN